MKIICLQENIERALALTNKLTGSRNTLPITTSTLIKTTKKGIIVTATDLENTIEIFIQGKIEEEGGILIPTRMLVEIINALPKEQVVIETKGLLALIKSGKNEVKINGIAQEEFPAPPVSEGKSVLIDELLKNIKTVVFSSGTDESRSVLTGILINFYTEGVMLVATDGYRLSLNKFGKPAGEGEEEKLIIPAKILGEAAKILQENCRFSYNKEKNQAAFVFEDIRIFSRLISGEFPSYEKIIPVGFNTKVVFDREELFSAVKISSIFARESANIVRISIKGENITLSANAPQVGENTCIVEGVVEGDDNEIAFNSRFLLEFLSNIDAKEIVFEMTGPLNPGAFKIPGDDSYLHIIMPVRVQG